MFFAVYHATDLSTTTYCCRANAVCLGLWSLKGGADPSPDIRWLASRDLDFLIARDEGNLRQKLALSTLDNYSIPIELIHTVYPNMQGITSVGGRRSGVNCKQETQLSSSCTRIILSIKPTSTLHLHKQPNHSTKCLRNPKSPIQNLNLNKTQPQIGLPSAHSSPPQI